MALKLSWLTLPQRGKIFIEKKIGERNRPRITVFQGKYLLSDGIASTFKNKLHNRKISNRNYIMSYFINNSPRSPQAAFPPLFMKRGAKHRRCDGVSQDISPMKMRHCFILITYFPLFNSKLKE